MNFVAFLLAVLISAAALVQQEWKEFYNKEGNFSVLMPGVPIEQKGNTEESSNLIEFHTFILEHGSDLYGISYLDFPNEEIDEQRVEKLFNGAREGATGNGTLISEKTIT